VYNQHTMFKRILVPTDGSAFAETGITYACDLCRRLRAQLTLLYVIDAKVLAANFLMDLGGMSGATPYLSLRKDIARFLQDKAGLVLSLAVKRCAALKIRARTRTLTGRVNQRIVEEGRLNDLTVIGQRGENAALGAELLGSEAEAVVRKSSSPLLITPRAHRPLTHALLAYDGSSAAKSALQLAARLTAALNLRLSVLTANPSQKDGRRILQEAQSYLAAYTITPRLIIARGAPAAAILAHRRTARANLIIMGFHGHSRIRELILGSTTEEVIRSAQSPVLLTH